MKEATTSLRSKLTWSIVGWLIVFVFFFPVLWMWLEAFKTEPQAASTPPTIFFAPTLEEFQEVLSGDFPPFFINSAIASVVSTFLVLALGLPAAYALAIRPVKRAQDALFLRPAWFRCTCWRATCISWTTSSP